MDPSACSWCLALVAAQRSRCDCMQASVQQANCARSTLQARALQPSAVGGTRACVAREVMLELMGFRGWAYLMCRWASVFAALAWPDGGFLTPLIAVSSSDCWLLNEQAEGSPQRDMCTILTCKSAAKALLSIEGLVWRSNHLRKSVMCD